MESSSSSFDCVVDGCIFLTSPPPPPPPFDVFSEEFFLYDTAFDTEEFTKSRLCFAFKDVLNLATKSSSSVALINTKNPQN